MSLVWHYQNQDLSSELKYAKETVEKDNECSNMQTPKDFWKLSLDGCWRQVRRLVSWPNVRAASCLAQTTSLLCNWNLWVPSLINMNQNFNGLAACIMDWEERILACNPLCIRRTSITTSSSRGQIMQQYILISWCRDLDEFIISLAQWKEQSREEQPKQSKSKDHVPNCEILPSASKSMQTAC